MTSEGVDIGGEKVPRPPDPRCLRVRQLLGRVGPNVQQFHRDGCRIAAGDVKLDTGAHLLAHCMREVESSVRAVLLEVFAPAAAAGHECGLDEGGSTHRQEIEAIGAALALGDDVIQAWIELVTGKGSLGHLAGRAHRRGLERSPRIGDAERAGWAAFEDLMRLVLPALEERFTEILPRFRALAAIEGPTRADLETFRALPNTYATRAEFFDNATAAWLPLLGARLIARGDDAFVNDPLTDELLPQRSAAIEYLARVGQEPAQQARFAEIVETLEIPHEWAALALVKTARAIAPEQGARCAMAFTRWLNGQSRLGFVVGEFAALAGELTRAPEHRAAGVALLRALFGKTEPA